MVNHLKAAPRKVISESVTSSLIVRPSRGLTFRYNFYGLPIAYTDSLFKRWFKMNQEETPGHDIYGCELLIAADDLTIIKDLPQVFETSLLDLSAAISSQPNGGPGCLTTSQPNIFYMKDSRNRLRVVFVIWTGLGWGINAASVEDGHKWHPGCRVFFLG